jgi:hypothetical protein
MLSLAPIAREHAPRAWTELRAKGLGAPKSVTRAYYVLTRW